MEPQPHPYDRHVGRYGQALAHGLISFADVGPGHRVLDVGCGTGRLTAELAGTVGGENVAAVDVAASALAVCRERVPDADLREASAEALPFADDAFDLALAQLVVNLVDDPPNAVREMARVVRPGGTVAACFWDDEEMPLLRSLWDAIAAVAPGALADVSEEARVGVADVEVLRDWWAGGGLSDVTLGNFDVSAFYEGFDDLWAPFEAGVGNSGRIYASLTRQDRSAVRDHAFQRLDSPEGPFRLTARVHAVRGVG